MNGSVGSLDALDWLETRLRDRAERVFIETTDDRVILYGDLDRESRRMALALESLGLTVGCRVAVQADKSPEAVFLYIACLRLGAIFMPLNPAYTPTEVEYFLKDAEPQVYLVALSYAESATLLCAGIQRETRADIQVLTLGETGSGSFNALAERMNPSLFRVTDSATRTASPSRQALTGDTVAALVYTSGTTGKSKGAMLTRANLNANARSLAKAWQFTAEDVLVHALPLFHVHGLFFSIDTVIFSGATLWLLPKFDVDQVLRALPHASVVMGVPTFYTRLLKDPRLTHASTATIRLWVSGSAPLHADSHREFAARTGHRIVERYGMTETLAISSNPYDGRRQPGSVSPALPAVELRISEQPIGSIQVRGANVFAGYYGAAEKTRLSFTLDGFFITGDLGYLDADGYLYIVGRDKDLIISGGFNVYPVEVEEAINALPGIVESAVIGLPHADFGEAVTAIVVASDSAVLTEPTLVEVAIIDRLRSRLSSFKLPKRVVFADEIPRNAMGKVQKQLLRTRYADLYS